MACERDFKGRVQKLRNRELAHQKMSFLIEVCTYIHHWMCTALTFSLQTLWMTLWYDLMLGEFNRRGSHIGILGAPRQLLLYL